MMGQPHAERDMRPVHVITEEHRELERFAGVLSMLRNAFEQGLTIHVATRTTCAEHLRHADDEATEPARAIATGLDADRMRQRVRDLDGDPGPTLPDRAFSRGYAQALDDVRAGRYDRAVEPEP